MLDYDEWTGEWTAAITDLGSCKKPTFAPIDSTDVYTLRWGAPEHRGDWAGRHEDWFIELGVEQPSYKNPTKYGDVWSYGCTMLEVCEILNHMNWLPTLIVISVQVFQECVPYSDVSSVTFNAMNRNGEHPTVVNEEMFETEILSLIKEIMETCWSHIYPSRPPMSRVAGCMGQVYEACITPS